MWGHKFMHAALRREWGFSWPSVAIGDMAPLIWHRKTFSLSSEGPLRPWWGFRPPITGEPKGVTPHSVAALKSPVAVEGPQAVLRLFSEASQRLRFDG